MDPVAGSRYRFGPHEIAERQVFRTSPLSFAIVNLRPTRPGHILYFCQLCDIGVRVEQYQRASSLTFTIQDGPHSGQTVPHVHVHIVPRRKEDFENNDNNNGMLITLNYEEQIIGVYGFQQIRSRTMTKAMIIAQSTFGWTSRLKTSSARLLLLKLPSIEKAGTWPVRSDDAWVHPDMCTSAS
uniref:HIT domain-containing protein n=1 Tax=Oryza rufipogon TaxID=4529 RepID=A0A0E0RD14_ORYRU